MTLPNFHDSLVFCDFEVSSPVLYKLLSKIVTKIFVIIVKFTKITKIFDHGNLELYGICNTFTPQIKGSCCGLNVMYHSSPGVLQLPWCTTTLPTGMCYN